MVEAIGAQIRDRRRVLGSVGALGCLLLLAAAPSTSQAAFFAKVRPQSKPVESPGHHRRALGQPGDSVDHAARRRGGALYVQRTRNKRISLRVKNGEIHDATVRLRETCLKGLGAPRERSRRWTTFYLPEKLQIRGRHRRFGWHDYADHTYEIDSWSFRGRVRKRWITGKLSHTGYVHASDENYFFHQECGTGRGYASPETKFAAKRS